jgi:hypothetical protein
MEDPDPQEVSHRGLYHLVGAWMRHFCVNIGTGEWHDLRKKVKLGFKRPEDNPEIERAYMTPLGGASDGPAAPAPDENSTMQGEDVVMEDAQLEEAFEDDVIAAEPPAPAGEPPRVLKSRFVSEIFEGSLYRDPADGAKFIQSNDGGTVWVEEKQEERSYISWKAGGGDGGAPVYLTGGGFTDWLEGTRGCTPSSSYPTSSTSSRESSPPNG